MGLIETLMAREYNRHQLEEKLMYTWRHFVWLAICAVFIALCFLFFRKWKPVKLSTFLLIGAIFLFAQELIQMMGMMHFLPYAKGHPLEGQYAPYFDPADFPLHLCSIQFFVMFIASRQKDEKKRKKYLAFFYPTSIFGASMALLMPNIFTLKPDAGWIDLCFISPIYYSFWLIHSFLLFCGLYIATDTKEVQFHFKDSFYGIFAMLMLGCASLMVNSAFTVVNRDPDNKLLPIEIVHNADLFFTTDIPIGGIVITKKWQWYIYFLILAVSIFAVFFLFYLPFYIIDHRKAVLEKGKETENAKNQTDL